jgi:hypothetical protein
VTICNFNAVVGNSAVVVDHFVKALGNFSRCMELHKSNGIFSLIDNFTVVGSNLATISMRI